MAEEKDKNSEILKNLSKLLNNSSNNENILKDIQAMPQSIDLERCILASALTDEDVHENLLADVRAEYFVDPKNELIFLALKEMEKNHEPLDHNLLVTQLKKMGKFEQAGGEAYLSELLTTTATTANIEHYVEEVKDKWILRTLIHTAKEINDKSYKNGVDATDALAFAEQKVFDIANGYTEKNVPILLKEVVRKVYDKILENQGKDGVTGLRTGLQELDKTTTGFQEGELIVVGARPGMGKTALGLSMALEMAKFLSGQEKAKPIIIFSLEMPYDQVIHRFMSAEAGVDLRNIRGGMSLDESNKVCGILPKLNNLPIYIYDGTVSVSDISAKCRRIAKDWGGLGCVMIDYLQLIISPKENKSYNRENEVSLISKTLKSLAKELKTPIVALAQVSRDVEKHQSRKGGGGDGEGLGNKPKLSDLRESGAIEQDADAVLFIHRDSYYFDKKNEKDMTSEQKAKFDKIKNKAEIVIAKQRNGPTGSINIGYIPEFAKFCERLDKDNEPEKYEDEEEYESGFHE